MICYCVIIIIEYTKAEAMTIVSIICKRCDCQAEFRLFCLIRNNAKHREQNSFEMHTFCIRLHAYQSISRTLSKRRMLNLQI